MVNAIAADEARVPTQYPDMSVGLHFELVEVKNVEAELHTQIEKFVSIIGKMPDHLDTHKHHMIDDGIKEVLEAYSKNRKIPVRNFGAKHIDSFGVNSNNASLS